MKTLLFALLLISFQVSVMAGGIARAFIVNNHNDTIPGEVALAGFNKVSGSLNISGFELESLHYELWFRAAGDKRFKRLTPDDILMYSFAWKDQSFEFRSFKLEKKGWIKSDKHRKRFLMLMHSSKVKLYKDVIRQYEVAIGDNKISSYYHTYDYYLYDEKLGLRKAQKSKQLPGVKDMLWYYGLEKEFIDAISKHATFKDLTDILDDYIHWGREVNT